jgi:hypothetical protein
MKDEGRRAKGEGRMEVAEGSTYEPAAGSTTRNVVPWPR